MCLPPHCLSRTSLACNTDTHQDGGCLALNKAITTTPSVTGWAKIARQSTISKNTLREASCGQLSWGQRHPLPPTLQAVHRRDRGHVVAGLQRVRSRHCRLYGRLCLRRRAMCLMEESDVLVPHSSLVRLKSRTDSSAGSCAHRLAGLGTVPVLDSWHRSS